MPIGFPHPFQVTCSFEGCTWKGDYSTLTEHEERCAATNTWHCPACQQQLPNAEQGAHVAACLAPQYEELHRRFQVLSRAQLALQCETDALAKRLKDVQLDMDQVGWGLRTEMIVDVRCSCWFFSSLLSACALHALSECLLLLLLPLLVKALVSGLRETRYM